MWPEPPADTDLRRPSSCRDCGSFMETHCPNCDWLACSWGPQCLALWSPVKGWCSYDQEEELAPLPPAEP